MTKNKKRLPARLSAALLTLVMLLTMVPAALAADGCPLNGNGPHNVLQWEPIADATCHTEGVRRGVCAWCHETVYEETPINLGNHDAIYTDEGNGYHSAICTYHPNERIPLETHDPNNSGVCSKCGAVDYSDVELVMPKELTIPVALNTADAKLSIGEVRLTLGKSANITDDYTITYNWYHEGTNVGNNQEYTLPATVSGKEGVYYYTVYVYATPKNSLRKPVTGSCTITVQVDELIAASATITTDDTSYYLGDPDAWSSESVVAQIYAAVQDLCPRSTDPDYVIFKTAPESTVGALNVGSAAAARKYYFESRTVKDPQALENVEFVPGNVSGDYTIGFTAYDTKGNDYAGVLTITVQQYAGNMDVVLSTSSNTPVTLSADDFEDFWAKVHPDGMLDSIRFEETPRSTEGSLYVDYISAAAPGTRVTTKDYFYVDPGRNQYDIDDVTFLPGVKQTDFITLNFEAQGTRNNGRVGYLYGTLYIFFNDTGSADITVSMAATGTALPPESFKKAFQTVTGGAGTSFYIQLLEVPAKGSLYVGRTATRQGTLLTSRTVINYPFSYSDSRGESISTVTYIPAVGITSESIRYVACSSQGKPLYTGRIIFTSSGTATNPTNPNNTPTTTTGYVLDLSCPVTGVNLSASKFENLLGAAGPKVTSVVLTPVAATYGTFYYDRSNTSPGSVIALDNRIFSAVTVNPPLGSFSLDKLSFIPSAGVTGTIPVAFTAYDAANNRYSGTLRITVGSTTTNPGTTTDPGTTTNPGTPANPTVTPKTFTDVPKTAGSYPYITDLTTSGALNGYPDGTFKPGDPVKLGEALKLIMWVTNPTLYNNLAPVTGDTHWASGYLDRAIKDGLLSANITSKDLDRAADRYTIAEVCANAIKLAPVTNAAVSPFTDMKVTDSAAKYVLALYNAKVITGSLDKSGQLKYYGTYAITREDFATIVWRLQSYQKNGVVGAAPVY